MIAMFSGPLAIIALWCRDKLPWISFGIVGTAIVGAIIGYWTIMFIMWFIWETEKPLIIIVSSIVAMSLGIWITKEAIASIASAGVEFKPYLILLILFMAIDILGVRFAYRFDDPFEGEMKAENLVEALWGLADILCVGALVISAAVLIINKLG